MRVTAMFGMVLALVGAIALGAPTPAAARGVHLQGPGGVTWYLGRYYGCHEAPYALTYYNSTASYGGLYYDQIRPYRHHPRQRSWN